MAYLGLPIYYTAVVVHRLFGGREDHHLGAWEDRLQYRVFLQGVPALICVIGVTVVGFMAWKSTEGAEAEYLQQVSVATEEKDYRAVEVCYTRLLGMRPSELRYRFGLGMASAELRDEARAERLIAPLAPDDRIGFAPAHLWMVQRLLEQSGDDPPTAHELQVAERHLIRLRGDAATAQQAAQMLMRLYVATARVGLVLDDPELRKAAEAEPETKLALVQELALRGRGDETKLALSELIRDFTARVRANRDDRASRVMLCKSLALSGDLRTAVTTAEEGLKLAPEGPFGELLADLMTARASQVRTVDGLTDAERRSTYRNAIDLLVKFGRDTTANDLKIAELARWLDDGEETERRLIKAAEKLPAVRLQLGDFYAAAGESDKAQSQWQTIADRYAMLDAVQQANGGERALAATAALRQSRFADAEALLEPASKEPGIANLRTQIYLQWADAIAKRDDADVDFMQFGLLKKADAIDPWNPAVVQRLLRLSQRDESAAGEVRSYFAGKIAEGNVPAAAYLMLGTEALQRNDRATAMTYLNQAYILRPQAVDVLNNLAWAMLTDDQPQIDRALELIEEAHKRAPSDMRVVDTRFRIYAKLGRWKEALTDVQACAAAMAGNRDFHLAAAEVYDQVNQPAIASEHRRRAKVAPPSTPE